MSHRHVIDRFRPSRRLVLRGAGVALCLPLFESFGSRSARAAATAPAQARFLPIFLPNGAPELWWPSQTGAGAAWTLSSVLEPLAPLKSRLTVVSGLENASVFRDDDSPSVEPPSRQAGAWLTCVDADQLPNPNHDDINGVSADQVIAGALADSTWLPSLQLGLSTVDSFCDGKPCSFSRSVSFGPDGKALYKEIDPKRAFALLTGALPGGSAPGLTSKAARSSVLDTVLASAKVVHGKLGRHDQQRLDQFLDSVRAVETQLQDSPAASCDLPPAPTFMDVNGGYQTNSSGYHKGAHADAMHQLIALAFQCNITRVISYMLEDERSEFTYNHVPRRSFTSTGSALSEGVCGNYHGAMMGSQDEFASIVHWNVSKVSDLCQKLSQLSDSDGSSVLDNTVVFLGSATHGNNYACQRLPAVLLGGTALGLKSDQHVDLIKRPLRDLYFTLMNSAFQLGVADFGMNRAGQPPAIIDELIAG